jgi:hypothetical protein
MHQFSPSWAIVEDLRMDSVVVASQVNSTTTTHVTRWALFCLFWWNRSVDNGDDLQVSFPVSAIMSSPHGVHVDADVFFREVLVYTILIRFLFILLLIIWTFTISGRQCISEVNPEYFSCLLVQLIFIYVECPQGVWRKSEEGCK